MDIKHENQIIKFALGILEERLVYNEDVTFETSKTTMEYFRLRLASKEHEVFTVAFLDTRHRLITCTDMFRGTIDATAVYPREVAKEALKHNAAAVIFAHNHPSGVAEPSQADRQITQQLKEALNLVDVRVLDHIVVGETSVSFSERGYL